jgi:hypothetical protein
MQTILQFLAFVWAFIAVMFGAVVVYGAVNGVRSITGLKEIAKLAVGVILWPLAPLVMGRVAKKTAAQAAAIQRRSGKTTDGLDYQTRSLVVRRGRPLVVGDVVREGDMLVLVKKLAWTRGVELWVGQLTGSEPPTLYKVGDAGDIRKYVWRSTPQTRDTLVFKD